MIITIGLMFSDRKVASLRFAFELVIRPCVLGFISLRLFSAGPSSLPWWWAKLTKNLQTEAKKGCLALAWFAKSRVLSLVIRLTYDQPAKVILDHRPK